MPQIVKAVIHQPNPDFKEAYFQLGNFICSLLYSFAFKIDANIPEYKINKQDYNKNFFFLLKDDRLIDENTKQDIFFLHDTKFELTLQKELILKCENIFQICSLIINTLSIYETIFDLQYVCFMILKRIYFTFPKFRNSIQDTLSLILTNLCCFTGDFERENSEESRAFIHYILGAEDSNQELKNKIKKRIEAKNINIELTAPLSRDECKCFLNTSE